MTYDESNLTLDALYQVHGKDYVVTGDNYPEIRVGAAVMNAQREVK